MLQPTRRAPPYTLAGLRGVLDGHVSSRYLDSVFRRRCDGAPIADAHRALTIAMKQLAESRAVALGDSPNHIRLIRDLRDEADQWLVLMVRDAVERGHTWAEVGALLGVTKQAAHERFAPLILAMAQRAVGELGPES